MSDNPIDVKLCVIKASVHDLVQHSVWESVTTAVDTPVWALVRDRVSAPASIAVYLVLEAFIAAYTEASYAAK